MGDADESILVSCRFSLKQHGAILFALIMREINLRYGRHNIGFLWVVVEPMLFTLGVTLLWSLAGMHQESSLPIAAIALTGYSSVLVWRNTTARCMLAVRSNQNLLYHQQIQILHLFLARIFLEVLGATASFLFLTGILVYTHLVMCPDNVLLIFSGWTLLAWFGAALAILMGSICELYEWVDRCWHVVTYLFFPLSGAGFLVDWLPERAQEIIVWFPMVNGVELVRAGFFGSLIHPHYFVAYTVFFCAILTFFGLLLLQNVVKAL